MTPEENRSRALALFEEVVNAHDATAIERFTSNPAIAGTLGHLLDGFPDLRFEVQWAIAEQDRVVAFIDMSGTQEGPWLMVQEATQRRLEASIMLALQFDADGMVVDSWLGTNFIAMLAQLGWGVAPEGQTVPGVRR
jgi:predicted ester cyclase